MKASFYSEELHTLTRMVETKKGIESESMQTIPASDFSGVERFEKEKTLFKNLPLIVGHSSQIPNPGDYLVKDQQGKSWLITRAEDGNVRAFHNFCQHRGTRLVHDEGGNKKRFSCPYHAWTYSNEGELVVVPRKDLFPGLDCSQKGLKSVAIEEAYGFLWLTENADQAQPIANFLEGLAPEFDALKLERQHVYFDKTRSLKANWKLPLDAFLEAYHISVLHKNSIGNYFVKNVAYFDYLGPHVRALVPRSNFLDINNEDWDEALVNDYVTPTYIVMPNVCFIFHPTSTSVITLYPGDTPDSSWWTHQLLVDKLPETDAEKAHYEKTIRILDGMTYEGEDFWVSEQIQQGVNAGAIDEITLGLTEGMIKDFHDRIASYYSTFLSGQKTKNEAPSLKPV